MNNDAKGEKVSTYILICVGVCSLRPFAFIYERQNVEKKNQDEEGGAKMRTV